MIWHQKVSLYITAQGIIIRHDITRHDIEDRGGSRIPRRKGTPTLQRGVGRQHLILPNFAKNCMKLRKFWAPPKSATGRHYMTSCHKIYNMKRHQLTWHEITKHDIKRHHITFYHMTSQDTWYDVTQAEQRLIRGPGSILTRGNIFLLDFFVFTYASNANIGIIANFI